MAYCAGADLTRRNLQGADLTGSNFDSALLDDANAAEADFTHVSAQAASMTGITLDGATLASASFPMARLVSASAQGVEGPGLQAAWSVMDRSDFRGSDLSGGYFGAATAKQANFSNAALNGADFSNADLYGAVFRGADLTNAILRGASLRGAELDSSTILVGADLTGATWVDGRACGPESIGQCRRDASQSDVTSPDEPEEALGSIALLVTMLASLITASIKAAKFMNDCFVNAEQGGDCFRQGDPDAARFAQISKDLAALQKELREQFDGVDKALAEVMKMQSKDDVVDRYKRLRTRIRYSRIAMQKYQELTDCVTALGKAQKSGGKPFTCTLTNLNGMSPEPHVMKGYADVYAGVNSPPSEEMSVGSPVERLYFATLWRFGGEDKYEDGVTDGGPTKLGETGRVWLNDFAGSMSAPYADTEGFLNALVYWQTTSLQTDQRGTVGATPRFIPGTFMTNVNDYVSYWVGAEGSFFPPVVTALTLHADARGNPPPADRKVMQDMERDAADSLTAMSLRGTPQNSHAGLEEQVLNYSFDLSKYSVNPDETKPVTEISDRPERVSFVLGSDGKVYRVQIGAEGTSIYSDARKAFDLPKFDQLEMLSRAALDAGVKWSTLTSLYPYALPGGENSIWWSTFGTGYNAVKIYIERIDGGSWGGFYVPNRAPGSSKFGTNVQWVTHPNDVCKIPTRMWDEVPSFNKAFEADRDRPLPAADPNNQTISARPMDIRKWGMEIGIPQPARANFEAVAKSGAVPVFNLTQSVNGKTLAGTGTLYRCGGDYLAGYARAAPAAWVSVSTYKPMGLFSMLMKRSGISTGEEN